MPAIAGAPWVDGEVGNLGYFEGVAAGWWS